MPEQAQHQPTGWFDVNQQELSEFFKPRQDPEGFTKLILTLVGIIFTPITLLGSLLGYKRAYSRFMATREEYPTIAPLRPIVRVAMIFGAIAIWILLYLLAKFLIFVLGWFFGASLMYDPSRALYLIAGNVVLTLVVLLWFSRWRAGIHNYMAEVTRYGSARFALNHELKPYEPKGDGFYIGAGFQYNKAGHLLTVAGTRAGKGVNIILPNLLMPTLFKGSWVVIDPKGENAAISARIQREAGRKVVLLNPWDLLNLGNTAYNPLDILKGDKMNLADDVQMIAECIVPTKSSGDADHFDNRARTFIAGLLLHLVTSAPVEDKHLGTLWSWLRLESDKWIELLADMSVSDDENAGEIIQATANEIASLMKQSEREYGSVMSTAQRWTDFIKSPAMRESMKTSDSFTSADLATGNTTVYVIIPADRLKTHNQWLRLLVSSLMRSVIRNPQKDVCFLLDEFYALGYLSEIDIALGSYAGYGVHIWAILQTLVQLQDLYGKNWENFLSSCSVRHFFNVSDNTTADYVSKMFGQTSVPTYNTLNQITGASARSLVNPDELRRASGDIIYTVIDQIAPARFAKWPYYKMELKYDENPYFKQ